jgi:hypothetical protein
MGELKMSGTLIGRYFVEVSSDSKVCYLLPETSCFLRYLSQKEAQAYDFEGEGYAIFDNDGKIDLYFGIGSLERALQHIDLNGGLMQWMH